MHFFNCRTRFLALATVLRQMHVTKVLLSMASSNSKLKCIVFTAKRVVIGHGLMSNLRNYGSTVGRLNESLK